MSARHEASGSRALLLLAVAAAACLAVITVSVVSEDGVETVLAQAAPRDGHHTEMAHRPGFHKMADGSWMLDEDMEEMEGYRHTSAGSWEMIQTQAQTVP